MTAPVAWALDCRNWLMSGGLDQRLLADAEVSIGHEARLSRLARQVLDNVILTDVALSAVEEPRPH